jgi:hypothetical protein
MSTPVFLYHAFFAHSREGLRLEFIVGFPALHLMPTRSAPERPPPRVIHPHGAPYELPGDGTIRDAHSGAVYVPVERSDVERLSFGLPERTP